MGWDAEVPGRVHVLATDGILWYADDVNRSGGVRDGGGSSPDRGVTRGQRHRSAGP